MAGFMNEERPIRTLREVLGRLRETYCSAIGYEVRSSDTHLCLAVWVLSTCWGHCPPAQLTYQTLSFACTDHTAVSRGGVG